MPRIRATLVGIDLMAVITLWSGAGTVDELEADELARFAELIVINDVEGVQ